MVNQWISFLFQTIPGFVLGFALDSMQQIRENAPPKWVRVGIFGLIFVAGSIYQMLIRQFSQNGTMLVKWMIYLVGAAVSARVCYRGKFQRHVTIHFLLILAVITGEIPVGLMLWAIGAPGMSLDFRQLDMAVISIIGCVSSTATLFLVAVLWRRFQLRQRLAGSSWALVMMPLCLLLPFLLYREQIVAGQGVPLPGVLSMAGAAVLNLVLVCVQFQQAQKEQAERELTRLRHQMELERQHYRSMEERREEMAKIRHDYNNLLSSVLGLLHMGRTREAEETVRELLARVQDVGNGEESSA